MSLDNKDYTAININNTLDACSIESFTSRSFYDLLTEAHEKNFDHYIGRVTLNRGGSNDSYFCYDAKHLAKHVYETVVGVDGRKIRIKNFHDPIQGTELTEINFYRLKYSEDLPLKAEYAGNHVTFLESSVFRSKIFNEDDPLDSLTVNFQFVPEKEKTVITKRGIIRFIILLAFILICAFSGMFIIRNYKNFIGNKYFESSKAPVNPHQPIKNQKEMIEAVPFKKKENPNRKNQQPKIKKHHHNRNGKVAATNL